MIYSYSNPIPFSRGLARRLTELSSGLEVHFYSSNRPVTTLVTLKSGVEFIGPEEYKYTYSFSHDAPVPLRVLWFLINDGSELRDEQKDFLWSPAAALTIPVGKPLVLTTTKTQPPKAGVGPVAISDVVGNVLAKGLASSYGPKNGSINELIQSP